MKLSLPYSKKEFENLKVLHRINVNRFTRISDNEHDKKKDQASVVLDIVDRMYKYINITSYNKYAKNRCKFSNSDDASEVCEGKFNNTLGHYSANGNCCRSCGALFLSNLKNELQN